MPSNTITRLSGGVSESSDTSWDADLAMLSANRYIEFFDDFICPASATASDVTAWQTVDDSGTGTNAFATGVNGGIYNIVTAAADNDYHAMTSLAEQFIFVTGKKSWFEARVKLAEATVLESTWWIGFTDTTTTGGMQANAAGPLADYDGVLFWKTPETAMTLNFETSNGTTQNTLSTFATTVTDTWTRVAFYWDGVDSITPYAGVNGTNELTKYTPQALSLTAMTGMLLVMGVKAGPTAGAETLQVDYIRYVQER